MSDTNPDDPAGGATPPTPPPADPQPAGDKQLGPGGEKALRAEREQRKALEQRLAKLAPLEKLAEQLGGGTDDGKSEVEVLRDRFAQHEKQLGEERTARWRAEVASEMGLTAKQAARLQGTSREELAADAADLLASFPAAAPGTPRPDPSQGSRGNNPTLDLSAQIADAKAKGDYRTVIALEKQKLQKLPTK
jgi:hypothetical protein